MYIREHVHSEADADGRFDARKGLPPPVMVFQINFSRTPFGRRSSKFVRIVFRERVHAALTVLTLSLP